ncbi:hypothetical protein BOX15_Mlig009586g1 [Macrostomum lignano]|uniref:Uncharacterized protein n=1 Tax=Macrostomum lignano TaxID=282301 RepID=A0A267GCC7_9PLAT|nr:hypothetical protein BOX15_Mlig010785g1 [Macrostomum lignano]PAA82902.1 hypothetical protein BOX15_Mlig009586g1 [Macrostomum lignano]
MSGPPQDGITLVRDIGKEGRLFVQHCPVYARAYYYQLVNQVTNSNDNGILFIPGRKSNNIQVLDRPVHIKGIFAVWLERKHCNVNSDSVKGGSQMHLIWEGNVLAKPPPMDEIRNGIASHWNSS